jgi:hypothetical protein
MALSLWDHEQRLLDLEHALRGVLETLLPDATRHATLTAVAQRLRARGHDGAAALLLAPASRSYGR